jgi:hypothetical protein
MIYLIVIVGLIAGAYYVFVYRLARNHVSATIHNAVRIINASVAIYLLRKYRAQYEENFAMGLGAAVTNALFGHTPNEVGRTFLKTNGARVQEELAKLKDDQKLCYVVSLATHMKANDAGYNRRVTADMGKSWVQLRELGILLPHEIIQVPSSPDDFMRMAREFEGWVTKN